MSAYTRQKARNRIRLERAAQKQSSDTHKTPYERVKRCRERKINIKASESVNKPRTDHMRADIDCILKTHFACRSLICRTAQGRYLSNRSRLFLRRLVATAPTRQSVSKVPPDIVLQKKRNGNRWVLVSGDGLAKSKWENVRTSPKRVERVGSVHFRRPVQKSQRPSVVGQELPRACMLVSEEIWETPNSVVLRADEDEASVGMMGWREREISEKTRRRAISFGTIPICENPEATPPGIEPVSPRINKYGNVQLIENKVFTLGNFSNLMDIPMAYTSLTWRLAISVYHCAMPFLQLRRQFCLWLCHIKLRSPKCLPSAGATAAEPLACSPPTKVIWAQFPAGSLRIFACGNPAGRCLWSTDFLGDLPFPTPFHSGAPPYSLQSPSSASNCKFFINGGGRLGCALGLESPVVRAAVPHSREEGMKLSLTCCVSISCCKRQVAEFTVDKITPDSIFCLQRHV
ncbi:hypothetical protein PR048_010110 [Dryococelus australis]|uniref:Uncharacterized protein n=1 Tax=Dryococelus australis TaxID=614101 RepID=A0ABQ9I2K7_9NEOP|nr:hypothetical protein PR048_010110 [Dryococelus australis]